MKISEEKIKIVINNYFKEECSVDTTIREAFEKGFRLGIRKVKEQERQWVLVSERLPEESGEYLVRPSDGLLEDYSDFSEVMIMPYDADCEAFGWWSEEYDPVTLGYVDSNFDEYEVVVWMPLPEPYKEDVEHE